MTESRFIVLLKSINKTTIYRIYIGNSSEFFTRLFTIIILWAGSYFVIQHELTPGELLSFYALIGYFTRAATSLIGDYKSVQVALILTTIKNCDTILVLQNGKSPKEGSRQELMNKKATMLTCGHTM